MYKGPKPSEPGAGWLMGGGETGKLIRSMDWSQTPLGPLSSWPQCLRVAVGICLNSRFPMHIWWGPDLINIHNDAFIDLLGKRHPQAMGRSAPDIWTEVWPALAPKVQAVMERGESTWDERAGVVLERNGFPEQAWFTWSYSPIYDEDSRVGGLMCVATEDTARVRTELERDRLEEERKQRQARDQARAEEALRDSTTLLKGISDSTGDIIFAKDLSGRMRFANPAALALIGKPLDEVLGRTDVEFLADKDAARAVMENDRRVMDSGRPVDIEETVPLADGSRRIWLSRKVPHFDADGKIVGLLGISRDVTNQKEAEQARIAFLEKERAARAEAERVSRMKDEFLATLSHELRTPLNAILGWSQILSQGAKNEEDLAEGLKTIERNARAQTTIIEDLLDMSRIISGKVRLDVQRVDLAQVVQASVDTVKHAADVKGVRLQVVLDPLVGPVSGDPARLQQVFWNLLTNAVKFTPRGGRIQVLLERINSHLEISIIDSGEGIKPEFLPHVFERFRQADASTTRRHGGLGLGLAIVKQLVELHGGEIRARSPGAGGGATFTVKLPLTALHPEPPAETERRHPHGTAAAVPRDACADIAGVKVLIVDDEPDARELVKRLLEDCQAVVLVAASATEALEKLQSDRPDVIASDIGMPQVDGHELMRRVRALPRDKGGDTPAIALTAYARAEDRVKAVMAGFQHHVAKPVEPSELIAMIASVTTSTFPRRQKDR